MNKVILLLILTVTIIVPCFSIPQFILNNQVTLTPEQKAEYERKVKERPDVYTYNPLHVGDKWWYNNDGYIHCGKGIEADTLINNIHVFKASAFGGYNDTWMYNIEDSVIVYDGFFNCDNNVNTEYLTLEDFSMSQDDQFFLTYWVWFYTYNYWITRQMYVSFVYQDYCNIFGEIVGVKAIMYEEMELPFQQWTLIWARKYGLISIMGEFYLSSCIAAQINGELFGDSTVVVEDQFNTEPQTIQCTAYPNPVNPTTKIFYSLPKEMQVSLVIYNIKGQIVKTLYIGKQKSGKHSVIWNGTDEHNRKVSSGVYFYKLNTPNGVLTNKMVLMK